jgi:hypothetical protein
MHIEHRQTSMPLVGFEATISVLERAKTVRGLDRAATAIGPFYMNMNIYSYNLGYKKDRHCDLVARIPGYRSIDPGSIPGTTRFF